MADYFIIARHAEPAVDSESFVVLIPEGVDLGKEGHSVHCNTQDARNLEYVIALGAEKGGDVLLQVEADDGILVLHVRGDRHDHRSASVGIRE